MQMAPISSAHNGHEYIYIRAGSATMNEDRLTDSPKASACANIDQSLNKVLYTSVT